ncbi:glycerophosphodiester phosphodiesterase family protein [Vannielia litorea]|uniref:glycerophosphodiester phosphodiesterase family protein n=1 Tax=Vannielia litorea TaxID=1217970 RepID=UPI001C97C32C|nr:glycerophosphodiester phosphodiesterase family protein [Vannielia litorea]MBY6047759.1 glycerophosphodiester phosphodiesterase [Vannielia litorea]MBY6075173.1 glycerophosphodiester phosphodiesterase [Vannielia litorea]
MRRTPLLALLALGTAAPALAEAPLSGYGPRPAYLIGKLPEGELKTKLQSCLGQPMEKTEFSIAHRGAPMMFPEHTAESYIAGASQGAGVGECDVTFTKDKELVCRHAQNDLHTTTNILVSDLAATCTTPFSPAAGEDKAAAECRTSEISLSEFKGLMPKMDSADSAATTAEEYQGGIAGWRTALYVQEPTILTHAESIALFKDLGVKMTPELKSPSVEMPFDGFTQADYAQKMIDEYKAAGVPASDVFPQSFNLEDVLYWVENEPEFGAQAVFLVEPDDSFDEQNPETWKQDFTELAAQGVKYLAPSMNMLVTPENGTYAASEYAKQAKAAGLNLITWSLERSGPLASGGGWYYNSTTEITDNDGDIYELVDTLAQDVEVTGIFSDWPATVTFYANCMGL